MSEELKPILSDFIYIDIDRVKSIYAQLYSGLKEQLHKITSKTTEEGSSLAVGGSPVGSLKSDRKKTFTKDEIEIFDPHDLILREVLRGLKEYKIIKPQGSSTLSVNDIVCINGKVTILDFDIIETSAKTILPALSKKGKKPILDKDKKKMLNLLVKLVPSTVGIFFQSDALNAWGTTNKKYFRDEVADLILKHGPRLNGEWYVLAIIDRMNQPTSGPLKEKLDWKLANSMIVSEKLTNRVLAIPHNYLSITPIIIFRKIS